jgi:hypothetical protein
MALLPPNSLEANQNVKVGSEGEIHCTTGPAEGRQLTDSWMVELESFQGPDAGVDGYPYIQEDKEVL